MALGGFWAKCYHDSFAFWKPPPQLRSVMAQKSCGCRSGLWEEAALVWYKIAVWRLATRSKWTLERECPNARCLLCYRVVFSPFYFTCFLRQEHFSWSIWILKKLKFSELRHPVCYLELLEHSLVVMHCALTLFISQNALFPFHNTSWKEEYSICHPSVLSLLFSSFLMGFLVIFRTVIPCSTALRTLGWCKLNKKRFLPWIIQETSKFQANPRNYKCLSQSGDVTWYNSFSPWMLWYLNSLLLSSSLLAFKHKDVLWFLKNF